MFKNAGSVAIHPETFFCVNEQHFGAAPHAMENDSVMKEGRVMSHSDHIISCVAEDKAKQ